MDDFLKLLVVGFDGSILKPCDGNNPMLRKDSIPAKSLKFGKEDTLQKQVEICREKYVPLGHHYFVNE